MQFGEVGDIYSIWPESKMKFSFLKLNFNVNLGSKQNAEMQFQWKILKINSI